MPIGGAQQEHSPEVRERAYQLYKGGLEHEQISQQTGVPVSTLGRWSSKGKWRIRRTADLIDDAKRHGGSGSTDQTTVIPADLSFEELQEHFRLNMARQAARVPAILGAMSDADLGKNADKVKKLADFGRDSLELQETKRVAILPVALLARPAVPLIATEVTPALADHLGELAGSTPAADHNNNSDSDIIDAEVLPSSE